jgi:hypothetical protein
MGLRRQPDLSCNDKNDPLDIMEENHKPILNSSFEQDFPPTPLPSAKRKRGRFGLDKMNG